ncbi:hypothetical protein ACTFIR_001044 [Dictyostelium discoideum]
MKLLISLILTITLLSTINVNAKETWRCIKSGQGCFIEGGDICPKGEYCNPNQESSKNDSSSSTGNPLLSGTCIPLIQEGQPCYLYQRCDFGLLCKIPPTQFPGDQYSVEGKCVSSKYLMVGENCSNNSECLGRLECKNQKCTPQDSEYGYGCYMDEDCPFGNFCYWGSNKNLCKPLNKVGSNCTYGNDCTLGSICRNNKCIEKFSLKNGEICLEREDCESYTCDYNLLENGNRNISIFNNYYCQKKEINSNDCKKDGCKNNGEICDFNSNKCLESYPIGSEKCKSATKLRDYCFIKNKCPIRTNFNVEQRNKKSCNMKYCEFEINNYLENCILESTYCK